MKIRIQVVETIEFEKIYELEIPFDTEEFVAAAIEQVRQGKVKPISKDSNLKDLFEGVSIEGDEFWKFGDTWFKEYSQWRDERGY